MGRLGKTQFLFSSASRAAMPSVEQQRGGVSPNCYLLPWRWWLWVVGPHGRSGHPQPGLCCCVGAAGPPTPRHSTLLSHSNPHHGLALHTRVQTPLCAHRAQLKQFSPILTTTHQHQGAKTRGKAWGRGEAIKRPGSGQIQLHWLPPPTASSSPAGPHPAQASVPAVSAC